MTVSVVLPVHNGEKYLKETLDSVFRQTYPLQEVIAIDHGSVDRSKEILISYPGVRYVYEAHQGNAHARNTGIKLAKSEYIAFIDQDDLWHPDKITKQMEILLSNFDILYTISHFKSFLSPGSGIPGWCRQETFDVAKPDYSPSSLVARKEVFGINGLFDEKYRIASDIDWFFLANDKKIAKAVHPETLHFRRVHDSNQSHHVAQHHAEMLRAIRQSVKRKTAKVD